MSNIRDAAYFPLNYDSARAAFTADARELSAKAGVAQRFHSFRVPSRIDPELFVDFLEIHAKRERELLLVVTSGVHGLESFAGSAIQRMLMREVFPGIDFDSTGIFLAHVMNPYGFKHGRRATENNVNLNRNFSASSDLFKIRNPGYHRYANIVAPQAKAGSPLLAAGRLAANYGFEVLAKRQTTKDLIEAVAQGQFEHAEGIEFGGFRHEPQTEYFQEALAKAARGYRDVIVMDLHTGLGDKYQLHLIPGTLGVSVNPDLRERFLPHGADADISAYSPQTSEGFYITHGDLNNMVPDLLEKEQRCLGATVEFGTLGSDPWAKLQSWNRLILENQGHHHGYASDRVRALVRRNFSELSYPATDRWKESVIAKSRALFQRLIERSAKA